MFTCTCVCWVRERALTLGAIGIGSSEVERNAIASLLYTIHDKINDTYLRFHFIAKPRKLGNGQ